MIFGVRRNFILIVAASYEIFFLSSHGEHGSHKGYFIFIFAALCEKNLIDFAMFIDCD